MSIQYALFPNPLTEGATDQRAVIQNQESRTIEDIIDEIVSRGSTVTRAEVLAVIEEYEAAITKFVANGDRVNTALVQVSSSISGIFSDSDDQYDHKRHQIKLNVNPGLRLKEATEDMTAEKVNARQRRPQVRVVEDHMSETKNDKLTPGGMLKISGSLLKYNPDDSEQGVFLLATDAAETKLGPVIRNKPSTLIIAVPDDLPAGEYKLEVRSILRYTSAIRSARLGKPLVVS